MSARPAATPSGGLSRVPYLPGLDGLRAIAVVAVMLYHANHSWLRGGFLGVEVFFVISGYLITLLLVGEHERDGGVDLRGFWLRRARRLLPALYVMMAMLVVYITAFYPAVREETRGDFLGGILYVSNWYQIFVGQGYASSEAFVPLRHLWSLAVEEQFYIVWPLVMVAVLRRSRRRLPSVGIKFIGAAVVVAVLTAVLFAGGFVPAACSAENSDGYWHLFGKCISINDFLYLGSFSRAGGLLLGAGFALLWRPLAILRGPLRDRGRSLDVAAGLAMVLLLWLFTSMYLFEGGYYNAWLFRGGFLVVGLATLVVIAAATHRYAAMGRLLGNPVFLWIGTRSYGLYLFHWPVYQIIRKQAQIGLSLVQFVLAMVVTVLLTEASYRLVETPIRKGRTKQMLRSLRFDRATTVASCTVAAVLLLGGVSMALADPQCVGAVRCSLQQETNPDAVGSTVPGTSPVQPSVITVPPTQASLPPESFVAVGESVMLGAAQPLEQAGVLVNAKENRGPEGVKNAVKNLVTEGRIGTGTTVIVQVGTNAPMSDQELDAIMAEVPADAASVVFMTLRAPVDWTTGNNERIGKLVERYPSVRILDWATESQRVELCPDGIHITCSVETLKFYANLVLAVVGLPTAP